MLGFPKHGGKDEENLTHFFRHYLGNYPRERETAKFESVRLEVSFIDASEAHLQHILEKRRLCDTPVRKYPYSV